MILKARRFKLSVFLAASLMAAAILGGIVLIPQWLSRQARLEVLRSHVGQVAQLAASTVDGDLHRQLLDDGHDAERYARAIAPLVRFHSAYPDIFYVYTMVDRGGKTFFVLDTAASPALRTHHELRASAFMEPFQLRKEYESDWLQQLAAGNTWINPDFEIDDYGTFLSAHAPIYDGSGRYSGFVGVDFDLQYYLAQEARFRKIGLGSLVAALAAALLIGYLAARYHFNLHHQLEKHYHTSLRDDLTGLLNRRGALDAIGRSLARGAKSYAALLIDIDDLKRINDTYGHAAGDAVITHVAEIIRRSIREGDECARLGGDEFLVFAADCDVEHASSLAHRIIASVAEVQGSLPHSLTGVSIGIAVQEQGRASFDALYRQADAALYRGKSQGKQRYTLFDPLLEG
jgi:diguanylate cyclase (GGDEF)-like protein